jgi:hypothetical protein
LLFSEFKAEKEAVDDGKDRKMQTKQNSKKKQRKVQQEEEQWPGKVENAAVDVKINSVCAATAANRRRCRRRRRCAE